MGPRYLSVRRLLTNSEYKRWQLYVSLETSGIWPENWHKAWSTNDLAVIVLHGTSRRSIRLGTRFAYINLDQSLTELVH
jgi:hypothetical protein